MSFSSPRLVHMQKEKRASALCSFSVTSPPRGLPSPHQNSPGDWAHMSLPLNQWATPHSVSSRMLWKPKFGYSTRVNTNQGLALSPPSPCPTTQLPLYCPLSPVELNWSHLFITSGVIHTPDHQGQFSP